METVIDAFFRFVPILLTDVTVSSPLLMSEAQTVVTPAELCDFFSVCSQHKCCLITTVKAPLGIQNRIIWCL